MKELFEAVSGLMTNFSLKRFIGFIISAVIFVALFVAYERYTNSFSLARIGKRAEILRTLQLIQKDGLPKDSPLEATYERLLSDLADAADRPPLAIPQIPMPRPGMLPAKWKFLAGASYWWLLAIIGLWELYRGQKHARSVLAFFFMGGMFFGLVGLLVPSLHWVVNYVAYPILAPIVLVAIFAAVGYFVSLDDQSAVNRTLEQGFKQRTRTET